MGVSEELVTHHAMLIRHIVIRNLPSSTIFFHIISQTTRLLKKIVENKMCCCFFYNFCM